MTRQALRASLRLWQRRAAYRRRKLKIIRRHAHANGSVTAGEAKDIHKWTALLAAADAMITRRKAQLSRRAPLRERAWQEMQKLIDAHVTEQGGNNRGPEVEAIIRANGGIPREAWCGDTVAVCYLRAGAKSVVRAWAAVSALAKLLTRVRRPKRGHVVTYTFDHTGLFDRWAPEKGAGYFYAGEGNTGDSGAQSDSKTGGDGVKLKLRHVDQVAGFWRVLR